MSLRRFVTSLSVAAGLIGLAATPSTAQPDGHEIWGAATTMWGAELSQHGRWVAAGCGATGSRSICLFDLDGDAETRLFPAPRDGRIMDFYWANDTHLIIHVSLAFARGEQNFESDVVLDRLIAFNAATGEQAFLLNDQSSVTSLTNVVSLDLDDPDSILMGLAMNYGARTGTRLANDAITNTVYRIDLDTGEQSRELRRRARYILQPVYTAAGELIAERQFDTNTDTYVIENAAGEVIYSVNPNGNVPSIYGAMDDGAAIAIYLRDDRFGLHRMDLATGDVEPIAFPNSERTDFHPITDPWGDDLVGFRVVRDGLRAQEMTDAELAEIQASLDEVLSGAFGPLQARLVSWNEARSRFIVTVEQPAVPTRYFLFERDTNAISPLGSEAAGLDEVAHANLERLEYEASDGLEIPAYLLTPAGTTSADGPFPLIVMPHGGPASYDTAAFDWWAQYYTTLGYAVFKPNFRGSSGYTEAFQSAGYGEFGGLMIQDMIDGVDHLVAEGIARPGGYCAVGASYGGYASLMLGLRDSRRVQCMVAVAPVTDPTEFVQSMYHQGADHSMRYWEQYIRRVDVNDPAAVDIAPARRAGDFRAPILLVHGTEDWTVRIVQSRQMDRAMRGNPDFALVEIEDEDHYLGRTESRQTILRESTDLITRTLPVD